MLECQEQDTKIFDKAMQSIANAQLAHEAGEGRENIIENLDKAEEILKDIINKELAGVGLEELREARRKINRKIAPADLEAEGHENSEDFVFEDLWRVCYEIAMNLDIDVEWNENLRRIDLPPREISVQ
jgi:hypothetical protein